jgi:hypothetical protein
MFPIFLSLVAWAFLVVQFLFHGFRIIGFMETLVIIAVLFVLIAIWSVRRLTRPNKKVVQSLQRAAAPAPAANDSGTVTFRVAGVTFDNDDGTSRQEILRALKFGDAPYAEDLDPDDLDVTIEETTWNGELAYAVLANGYQIGNVPKASITKVKNAKDHVATCSVTSARIIGGGKDEDGNRISYGCEVTMEY